MVDRIMKKRLPPPVLTITDEQSAEWAKEFDNLIKEIYKKIAGEENCDES